MADLRNPWRNQLQFALIEVQPRFHLRKKIQRRQNPKRSDIRTGREDQKVFVTRYEKFSHAIESSCQDDVIIRISHASLHCSDDNKIRSLSKHLHNQSSIRWIHVSRKVRPVENHR